MSRPRNSKTANGVGLVRKLKDPQEFYSLHIGHPPKILRTLRWTGDPGSLNPGAGGICSVGYLRVNSCYDPDGSGSWGNEQPRCFDQYLSGSENSTGMYSQYTVLKSKVSCIFVNTDSTNSVMVGMTIKSSTGTYSNYQDYAEDGKGVWQIVGPSGSGANIATLAFEWDCKKFFGIADPEDGAEYTGLGAANPTVGAYVHIWASGFGTDTGAVTTIPTMDMTTSFRGPILPAQS